MEGFFARQRAAARGSQQRALERAGPGAAAPAPAPGRGGGERGRSAGWAAACAALDKERKKQTGELRVLLDDAGRIRPDLAGALRARPATWAPGRQGNSMGQSKQASVSGVQPRNYAHVPWCNVLRRLPGQCIAVRLLPRPMSRQADRPCPDAAPSGRADAFANRMWRTSNASGRAAALDALAASARDAPTAARLLHAPKLQPALNVRPRSAVPCPPRVHHHMRPKPKPTPGCSCCALQRNTSMHLRGASKCGVDFALGRCSLLLGNGHAALRVQVYACAAERDQQTSMLRALLAALGALASAPRQPRQPGPRWDKQLVRAVARLAKHRRAARASGGHPGAEGGAAEAVVLPRGPPGLPRARPVAHCSMLCSKVSTP